MAGVAVAPRGELMMVIGPRQNLRHPVGAPGSRLLAVGDYAFRGIILSAGIQVVDHLTQAAAAFTR